MKLINREFDPQDINESLTTKHGRYRKYDPNISRHTNPWFNTRKSIEISKERHIDFEAIERAQDDLYGDVYTQERKFQPRKQHMRIRWNRRSKPTMEWYSDLDHGRWELDIEINGFIEKNVGKSFAEVYSKFCKDPRFSDSKVMSWELPRQRFISCFKNPKLKKNRNVALYKRCRYSEPDYIIDDQGLIQINPDRWEKPVSNKVHMHLPESMCVYHRRVDRNVYILHDLLKPHIYRELTKPEPSQEAIEVAIEEVKWNFAVVYERFKKISGRYYTVHNVDYVINSLFPKTYTISSVKVTKNTKEYFILKRKIKSAKANKKKPDNSAYYDQSMYLQRCRAKNSAFPYLIDIYRAGSVKQAIYNNYLKSEFVSCGFTFGEYVSYHNLNQYIN